jgi:CARDB
MNSFRKKILNGWRKTNMPAVEPLESRTLFDLVPAIASTLPASLIATIKTNDAVTVNLKNTGGATISGSYTLSLFASLDQTLDGSDTQIVSLTTNLAPLKAGATHAVKLKLAAFPDVPNSDYFVLAEVTGSLAGAGDNAAISGSTIAITDPFIDLSDSIVRNGKTSVDPGQTSGGETVTIFNNGNVMASGVVAIEFEASTSPDGSSPAFVATEDETIRIAPGKSKSFHNARKTAVGSAPGSFYTVAIVDPGNTFDESNTTNNTAIATVPLTILDPYANLLGTFVGPFDVLKGPDKGLTGTTTWDITAENDTDGHFSGTIDNSAGVDSTVVGILTTKGVITAIKTDTTDTGVSSIKAKIAASKITGITDSDNGNVSNFSVLAQG